MTPHRIVVVVLMGVLAQLVPGGGGGMEVAAQQAGCPELCANLITTLATPGCVVLHQVIADPDALEPLLIIDAVLEAPPPAFGVFLAISPQASQPVPQFSCRFAFGVILAPLTQAEYGACLMLFHQEVVAANCERVQ